MENKLLVNSFEETKISMIPLTFEKIKGNQIKYVCTEPALDQVKYKNEICYKKIYS